MHGWILVACVLLATRLETKIHPLRKQFSREIRFRLFETKRRHRKSMSFLYLCYNVFSLDMSLCLKFLSSLCLWYMASEYKAYKDLFFFFYVEIIQIPCVGFLLILVCYMQRFMLLLWKWWTRILRLVLRTCLPMTLGGYLIDNLSKHKQVYFYS